MSNDQQVSYDPLKPYRKALKSFIDTIEATGGCTVDDNGVIVPCIDEEWADLADAYLQACEAMDVEPIIRPN